ncbi:hypothetical protein GW920_02005 [Candidatus Falkowbacteria bacterium]|uniref:Uncharacterized protein n=1 Tax=Candidatus Falkowbacteria bacterium CG10_big_fil_rev_8_21_14_0_10_37_18 TaxID=1974562 RepID=A0A2H0V838_9BACT|nr:hypothetical protein [Candidatus Falkowbacteria bacterium]NCQ13128.1 hypothetical protein [Candidatus Falkowbacteria bacterium]PIR95267.1 MAG: hypothetical protein COT93_03375 [Candidatus Falkowbacteria bacterium CG10_big_fil_rev_8_21_14_0_10_37_18]
MIKTIKTLALSLVLSILLILPAIAAEKPDTSLLGRLKAVGGGGGYQTDQAIASTPIIIGMIIGAFFGFLGITFIVLMVIAGFNWMTARGNDEQIQKSKDSIRSALIGLVVSLSGWTIWNFIFNNVIAK